MAASPGGTAGKEETLKGRGAVFSLAGKEAQAGVGVRVAEVPEGGSADAARRAGFVGMDGAVAPEEVEMAY